MSVLLLADSALGGISCALDRTFCVTKVKLGLLNTMLYLFLDCNSPVEIIAALAEEITKHG